MKSTRPNLIRTLFFLFLAASAVAQAHQNVANFDFAPASQWVVPFPNDIFTLSSPQMITQRRVNLPLPPDANQVSERKDIESVNILDGFSIFPRITVPLTGAVPDEASFTSANVFLVALAPAAERGRVIPIDQRIIDNSVEGSPRLIFAPDEYLSETSRYAIVVTNGLTAAGQPFAASTMFREFLDRHRRSVPPAGIYEATLFDAMNVIVGNGIAPREAVVTLSVFTTRTISDVPLKLIKRLNDGEFPVQPARFTFEGFQGPAVYRAADIENIDSFVHRASRPSDGAGTITFPPKTLRVQGPGPQVGVDIADEIYVENVRTRTSIRIPQDRIDTVTGALIDVDVSKLAPAAGDELAVIVRKRRLTPVTRPFYWGSVGAIAFGVVDAPIYTDATGVIPPVATRSEYVPPQTGTSQIPFALFVPITPQTSASSRASATSLGGEGWPLVHLMHGGAETNSSFISADILNTAPILASRGMATVAFVAAEFEGGPRSRLQIRTRFGGVRSIPATGRAIDVNADGIYEQTELYIYPQRMSDLAAAVRSLQLGIDLNGDGRTDITRDPARTYIAGVSFGGATAFIAAALEPNAAAFVANVPSSEGSRARGAGFHPLVAARGRALASERMATRTPSLLNSPSPTWGDVFNEDIPMKRQPVQVGMVPGAEAIQRAFDFNMWRDLENMPLAYARHVASGALRGGPAAIFVQVARGDGAAINPVQAQMIRAGQLHDRTGMIRFDVEPRFDEQWSPSMPPELARHVHVALPYAPNNPSIEIGGRIGHYARVQMAEYLKSQGTTVFDPDVGGTVFAGDVFEFPLSDTVLEQMLVDPGLGTPATAGALRTVR